MKKLTREQVAFDLFKIYTHAELVDGEEAVYREADLVKILMKWGIPKPKWSGKAYMELFESRKK